MTHWQGTVNLRLSMYRGAIQHVILHSTIRKFRSHYELTKDTHTSPSRTNYGWLSQSSYLGNSDVEISGRSHDDVIKRKHFPSNWPFVRGIHRSPGHLEMHIPFLFVYVSSNNLIWRLVFILLLKIVMYILLWYVISWGLWENVLLWYDKSFKLPIHI